MIHAGIQVFELLYAAVEIVDLLLVADHVVLDVLQLTLELLHTKHDALDTVVQQLFLRGKKQNEYILLV